MSHARKETQKRSSRVNNTLTGEFLNQKVKTQTELNLKREENELGNTQPQKANGKGSRSTGKKNSGSGKVRGQDVEKSTGGRLLHPL
jgi:hypothetical protein